MPKVEVLKEICKSCLYCVKVCPKEVLGVANEVNLRGYQYILPVNPDACTGCALCATMCPDAAIEVYK